MLKLIIGFRNQLSVFFVFCFVLFLVLIFLYSQLTLVQVPSILLVVAFTLFVRLVSVLMILHLTFFTIKVMLKLIIGFRNQLSISFVFCFVLFLVLIFLYFQLTLVQAPSILLVVAFTLFVRLVSVLMISRLTYNLNKHIMVGNNQAWLMSYSLT